MFYSIAALSGLASMASAHIVITNPVPYPGIDNSPLLADGSNFPCKGVSYDAAGVSNTFAAGSEQTLEFKGTAVHGGGSCQISVTTDLAPTKDSVWKVIKSIEGGCPARDTVGNIGNDAEAPVPFTYSYTIPEELAAGDYTLAWTWFNKIGNREMYMNCAPLTVTGGGSDTAFIDTLPDMMTANIGGDCTTEDSKDVQFPDPGNNLEQLNGATQAFAAPSGAACGPAGNPQPAPTPTPAPTPAPEDPAPVPELPTSAGGIFLPIPSPEPETPGTPTGAFPQGEACSPEGTFNCIDGASFQQCASGMWAAPQAMSAGTTCQVGQAATLTMNAAKKTRRFSHKARKISA